MKIPCTVEILTRNSGKTLSRCLESVQEFDDIIVVDGNSTDDTVAIAQSFGARIIPQFDSKQKNLIIDDFSRVRNIGINNAKHPWFLFVDSDEYLSKEAVEEMREIIAQGDQNDFFVYRLPRKYVVEGEVIDRSSMYPNYQIRFFYLPAVEKFVKKVHEKIRIKEGYRVGTLKHPEYVPFDHWRVLKEKWFNYAKLQTVHSAVTSRILLPYTFSNTFVFLKYLIKYILTFINGSGKRMPFVYEWYNAYYHIQLIHLAWIQAFRRSE